MPLYMPTPSRRRRAPRGGTFPRRFRRPLAALVFAAFLLAGGFFFCTGKVIRVADGDTVVVLTGVGTTQTVRLYGVDCPESGQRGGVEATEFARELLLFAPVSLSVVTQDQYGRSVALVRLADGRIVNEELVKAGHAWVYRTYCREAFCAAWLAHEYRAKKQALGLWKEKNPMPPWRWRRARALYR